MGAQVNLRDLAMGQPPSANNPAGLQGPHDPTVYGFDTACAAVRRTAQDLSEGINASVKALMDLENLLRVVGGEQEISGVMQMIAQLQQLPPKPLQICKQLEDMKQGRVQQMQMQLMAGNQGGSALGGLGQGVRM
jgi:hypothetical protein